MMTCGSSPRYQWVPGALAITEVTQMATPERKHVDHENQGLEHQQAAGNGLFLLLSTVKRPGEGGDRCGGPAARFNYPGLTCIGPSSSPVSLLNAQAASF